MVNFLVLRVHRLGRPVAIQLCRHVSFDDLVSALLTNLSDVLREDVQPAVSIVTHIIVTSTCHNIQLEAALRSILVSEMTCYVSSGTLNPTHSLT